VTSSPSANLRLYQHSFAYVLTRPLGANLGDWLALPTAEGEINLGTAGTSVVFLAAILATVVGVGDPSALRPADADGPVRGLDQPRTTRATVDRVIGRIVWKPEPEDHDYPAARAFLDLVVRADLADLVVDALRSAVTTAHKSKDLLRASGLSPLDSDNAHVAKDLRKISEGVALSPVLLVRGDVRGARPLVIADGFHRICAVHLVDDNADIHCRIVDLPEG
jgi:hypothetical protein